MSLFETQSKEFQHRHNGPNESQTQDMLKTIGVNSLDELIDRTVPESIRMNHGLNIPPAMSRFA